MQRSSVMKAALMGGLLAGIASAIPLVSALNTCCCALVLGGGVFSAWVLRSDGGALVSSGRCAGTGLLAGVVAAIIATPLGALLNRLVHDRAQMEKDLEAALAMTEGFMSGASPAAREFAREAGRASAGLEWSPWLIVIVIITIPFFAIAGLLGGQLGASMFKGQQPPHPPPPPGGYTFTPPVPVDEPTPPTITARADVPYTPPHLPSWTQGPDDDGPSESGELSPSEWPAMPEPSPVEPERNEPDSEPSPPDK